MRISDWSSDVCSSDLADDRHTAARAKGKVERPFRTVKEVHETLYHFHKPKDEAEANLWMRRALVTYNNGDHRSEPHARIEHWLRHLPGDGVRAMCSWERFCAFAREPERRTVDRKSTRLTSRHSCAARLPPSASHKKTIK